MKTIFTLAILSSIAAAPAMAESFSRDGVTYTYTVKSAGEYQVISGKELATGRDFRLRVKGDKVSGRFGDRTVSFLTTSNELSQSGGSTVFAAK